MKILEVDKIRKEYSTLVAVNNVSFSIDKGQVLGLIGPNGAGKTTLLRILATVLRPTNGSASLFGYDLRKQYLQIKKSIGFLPDFFNLYSDLKLTECLEFFARAYGVETNLIPHKINEVLDYVDLQEKRGDYIKNLSRGMVQRMGIAALLVHEPDLFLLDEPASGLDPKARINLRRVLTRLSAEGKTVVISSHILTELSGFCSHIAIMNKGNFVMYGAVDEIQRKIAGAAKINISVLDNPENAVALIKRLNNAKITGVSKNLITVELAGGPREIADLNEMLVNAGIKVISLFEEKADLEDLFMKISSEQ
jgi:ABC-2 type transport system ATP-binding protein